MPLDPDIAGLLAVLAASEPPLETLAPREARAGFAQLAAQLHRPEDRVRVASVQDATVDGAEGPLPARIYRPDEAGPLPTVVLFHGGGWMIGDLETHDDTARALARDARAVVVSVAYRLAPESPYPAAVHDAVAATRWALAHRKDLGGNDAVAVAGDSAGGNLAAVVALELRTLLAAQLLIYPCTDAFGAYPSRIENARGYFLETSTVEWFLAQYAGHVTEPDHTLSPMLATRLAGVPPALIVTAELDPLRDEGEAYAARLRDAGVRVEVRRFDGLVHGFLMMVSVSAEARRAAQVTCAMLGEVLHP